MTDSEKAKILDSIEKEFGYMAEYLAKGEFKCECDVEVGWVCENCSIQAILSKVAGIHKAYFGEGI